MAMTLAQLQSQLSGLEGYTPESEEVLRQRAQAVYDPQYEQDLAMLRDNLQQSVNATERGAIRTGMQRSSYNNASLVGLVGAGQKAQAQLAAQREGNIANLLLQLIQGEKDRKAQADQQRNNLLLNLYQLGQSGGSSGSGGRSSSSALAGSTGTEGAKGAGLNLTDALQKVVTEFTSGVPSITQQMNDYIKKVNTKGNIPYGTAINNTATGGSGKNYLLQEGRLAY